MSSISSVVGRFLCRGPGHARTLMSDGQTLWSYSTGVGVWRDGEVVVLCPEGTISKTTSRHVGLLRAEATRQGIPISNEVAVETLERGQKE